MTDQDYRSLEVQYTDLNRLWMAKCKEADALRAELTGLADVAHRTVRELGPADLNQHQFDTLKSLSVNVGLARRTLGGN